MTLAQAGCQDFTLDHPVRNKPAFSSEHPVIYRIVPMQRNPPLRRNGVWGKGEAQSKAINPPSGLVPTSFLLLLLKSVAMNDPAIIERVALVLNRLAAAGSRYVVITAYSTE